jgi:redox-sensitive bicupin YhaK (pirin superfamily)
MITVRRAADRQHDKTRTLETWLTFGPQDRTEIPFDGLENLELLQESRLAPGARVPRASGHDAEIVTYVCEGALAYDNSIGASGIVQAGEFQRVTAGRGLHRNRTNASRTDWVHFFQIWVRPSEADLDPGDEQKRFTTAQRRGGLCIVASLDARRGSLHIHQDALIYSALLNPGQHVIHELPPGRSACLHLVQGEVTLGDLVLSTGDGASITAEQALSLTASEESEVLLVDLRDATARTNSGRP